MGFQPVDALGGFVGRENQPEPEEEEFSDFEIVGAALRTENTIGSFFASQARHFDDVEHDASLDVFGDIAGTKYEQHFASFAEVRNRAHMEAVKADIDRETEDRRILEGAGGAGFAAMMVAGGFDLPTLLPTGALIKTAKAGHNVLKIAGATAVAGGIDASLSEAALQTSQQTRTVPESAVNIGASVILSGVLGAGAGALIRKGGNQADIEARIESDMTIPADDAADVYMPGSFKVDVPGSIAAKADAAEATSARVARETLPTGKIFVYDAAGNRHVAEIIAESETGTRRIKLESGEETVLNNDKFFDRSPDDPDYIFQNENLGTTPVGKMSDDALDDALDKADGLIAAHKAAGGTALNSPFAKIADRNAITLEIRRRAGTVAPSASVRGASVGAAAVDEAENVLKSAFGLEKGLAFQDPLLRLQTSASNTSRAHIQELAETPLTYTKAALGFETAPLGTSLGQAGAVETHIKFWNAPLSETVNKVDDEFVQYRKGRSKRIGDLTAIGVTDAIRPGDDLTRRQFGFEVSKAMRNNDEHSIPEVAKAAKFIRKTVLDPLKDAAIEAKLLDEDVDVTTADSYLNRIYNREKIISDRGDFKDKIANWLTGEEDHNAGVAAQLDPLVTEQKTLAGRIKKLEKKIERRSMSAEKAEARQEELSRLNKFAFQRSERLSQPLDDLRGSIDKISEQIQDQLDRIEDLTLVIREERQNIPGLVEVEGRLQKLSRGLSGINKQAELVDVIEAVDEISAGIEGLKNNVKPVLAEMRADARTLREGNEALAEAEKARAALGREIKPFRKELTRLRKELRETRKKRIGKAQEGAVFETKIRGRGNKLSDQVSGRNAELDTLNIELEGKKARFDEVQELIEGHVTDFRGNRVNDARGAVKSRDKAAVGRAADKPRLRVADKKVLGAARKILKREPIDDPASLSDEIIERIIGTPDGRLPYDAHTNRASAGGTNVNARGPLKQRVFNIPDNLIEDFLDNDIDALLRAYTRTLAPDVEITKRFGSVDMVDQIKEIGDEYNVLIAKAETKAERVKLQKRKEADQRDLGGVRDRLRGTFATNGDPNSMMARTGQVVRSLNYLRLLGGMTISAIPDLARPVMVHGMTRVFRDGLVPLFTNFGQLKLAAQEVKMAGTALDMTLDSRAMLLADIGDEFGRNSKFERGIKSATQNFGIVSLMAPWNAAAKQFTGVITMTRIIDAAEKVAKGKASKKEIEALAAGGISEGNARKIAEQFSSHGEKSGGVSMPNTAQWADQDAVNAFRAALVRDVDRIVVTPGQDKPLFMSTDLGRFVGQFKSFAIASTQRTLISGLQQRDAAVLNGALMAIALGGIVHIMKGKLSGFEADTDFSKDGALEQFLVNSFDRSGLSGWLMDANNMLEKVTRARPGAGLGLARFTGKPVSRYGSRNIVGALIGPTAGTIGDFTRVTGAAFNADFDKKDARALRRLLPYQNLFYMRKILDQAEAGIADALGVPDKR